MQVVLRNTDLLPVQVTFDDGSVISIDPDDEVTLQANAGAGIVVQADSTQTHGIMPPPYSVTDNEAIVDLVDETDEQRRRREDREDFRPGADYSA